MTSKAATVDEWMGEVPPDRLDAIQRLRALCRDILAGYEECMAYGMPCYKRGDVIEAGYNSQKQYIALYMLKRDVVDEFRDQLGASSIGKGCIRYTSPKKMDFAVIERLLRRHVESSSAPC
jgi:uncharacterized protein YdhG (YjbR/CyaY superfamily)